MPAQKTARQLSEAGILPDMTDAASSETQEQTGRILRGIAGFYYVENAAGEIYACRARGSFRKDDVKPLPGDGASFIVTHEGDKEGNLTAILPRRNALIRPAVANVDQALLFFSLVKPDPSALMLDRYLLFLAAQGLPAILCFNKTDIATDAQREEWRETYRLSGHPVLFVSVKTGEGLPELKELLAGRITFLAGPSGAGKSSLINRLCPRALAQTGELSKKLGRGKNTTRHSELFRVEEAQPEVAIPEKGGIGGQAETRADDATWLIDTPGFTAMNLPEMEEERLQEHYAEFAPYRAQCRFTSCRHLSEPDCAVHRAAEEAQISMMRYENYGKLYEELKGQRKY